MTETEKKYDAIRRAYPETISKEQFYRIAHISKATALHLLQNGLVPCKDTGKKTRRYTIRTDDVITYLIDREIHPEKYGAPDHWYRDRSGYRRSRNTFRYELSSLSEIERKLFEEYTRTELASYAATTSMATASCWTMAKAVPVRSPLLTHLSVNTFAAQSCRLSLSWKKTFSIRKICADAKSAVHVTSPVRDAPNTALIALPKYIASRRPPTPEKRGRA